MTLETITCWWLHQWLVFLILIAGFVALRFQDRVEPSTVVLAAALLVLLAGAVRWRGLPSRRMFLLQVTGTVGFVAVALIGLAVAPDVGRYVIAAGWLAHGLWDFAHLRANKVVSRSYAELSTYMEDSGPDADQVVEPHRSRQSAVGIPLRRSPIAAAEGPDPRPCRTHSRSNTILLP